MLKQEGGFPAGYDQSGKSLYYNTEHIYKPLSGWNSIFASRVLRFGQPSDIRLVGSTRIAHADQDREESLKEYIRTSFGIKQIPVYIFDDHNHALFAWYEALNEHKIEKGVNLLHFDDHPDSSIPERPLCSQSSSLQDIADYARSIWCDVFIEPALSSGLIQSVYWVNYRKNWQNGKGQNMHRVSVIDTQASLSRDYTILRITNDLSLSPNVKFVPKRTIVDIDIDYFDSITDPNKENAEIERLREEMTHADVITIATSPGFISGERAIRLANELLRN
ncbi:UPF0489 family protein [Patescibacteria group bacterium]|nr:UPF0489 family protein [Patescibacteria group bacterium]